MKRLGNIYADICTYENILDAFGKVQKGKRHRADIADWRNHLEANINALLADLEAGDYRFGDYYVFKVFDPKERTIYAASVRERVIHHAVINICGPRLESCLIDDSYACRSGKGQLRAVRRAQVFAKRYDWVLKLDMKSYFDSIDQSVMMSLLERKLKDSRVLQLFRELLASYSTAPGKGLPIGNLTSQYLANLYLDPFDRWAGCVPHRAYVRYMDDVLVFGEYEDLRRLKQVAAAFLQTQLQLTLKHGGDLLPLRRGVDFLGYRLFPECLLLNHRSKRRFKMKQKKLDRDLLNGKISQLNYQKRITALTAFAAHADTFTLRGHVCLERVDTVYSMSRCDISTDMSMADHPGRIQQEILRILGEHGMALSACRDSRCLRTA